MLYLVYKVYTTLIKKKSIGCSGGCGYGYGSGRGHCRGSDRA